MTFSGVDPCRTNNAVQQPWYNIATNPNRAQLQLAVHRADRQHGFRFRCQPQRLHCRWWYSACSLGNPDLKSESASTWTVGGVFRRPSMRR